MSKHYPKFSWPQNAIAFGSMDEESDSQPILGHGTTCCAAKFLSVKEYHTLNEIKESIRFLKKDSETRVFSPKDRDGGEKLILVTVCDFEPNLRKNLIKLNFKKFTNFPRRRGYPKGHLELWGLNLEEANY